MNTRQLILVKHSMVELVPNVPSEEWHLSDIGRLRAKTLAEKLAMYQPSVIVSSASPKAMETAQVVAERLGLPHETEKDLRENDRTGLGFVGRQELEATIARFFQSPERIVMGNESADAAYTRFSSAVTRVIEKYPREDLVVVAHGTVITLFVTRKLGLEPFAFWKRLGLPSFVVLDCMTALPPNPPLDEGKEGVGSIGALTTITLQKVVENVE